MRGIDFLCLIWFWLEFDMGVIKNTCVPDVPENLGAPVELSRPDILESWQPWTQCLCNAAANKQ